VPYLLAGDAGLVEDGRGTAGAQKAEEQMPRAHRAVVGIGRRLGGLRTCRQPRHLNDRLGGIDAEITDLEPVCEPLPGRLLRHSKPFADQRPRQPRGSRGAHIMLDQPEVEAPGGGGCEGGGRGARAAETACVIKRVKARQIVKVPVSLAMP
jgi:hypothetical protein